MRPCRWPPQRVITQARRRMLPPIPGCARSEVTLAEARLRALDIHFRFRFERLFAKGRFPHLAERSVAALDLGWLVQVEGACEQVAIASAL
jgi:hypothetical protein